MLYQLIIHCERPLAEETRGHIFGDKVLAYKCAYEHYKESWEEGCTVFAGPEVYEEFMTVVDFISALLEHGQVLISCENSSHIYISYAESEPE